MGKEYMINIEKWKQNGLTGEWGPLWPTEDCEQQDLFWLSIINRDLRNFDTAKELDPFFHTHHQTELGRKIHSEYRQLIRPFWTDLVDLASYLQPHCRFHVQNNPFLPVYLSVDFPDPDPDIADDQKPLWPAKEILNHWSAHHIDDFHHLDNGFTWRGTPDGDEGECLYKVAVQNDLVYFCVAIGYENDSVPFCVIPLETVNEILAYFPGAEAAHRKQRQKLLKQRNWDYRIFAYRGNFDHIELGVAFEDSLDGTYGFCSWPDRLTGSTAFIDALSYQLWECVRCYNDKIDKLLDDLKTPQTIRRGYAVFVSKDGWIEHLEYMDIGQGYYACFYCLPYRVFRDILLDMRMLLKTGELKRKDPMARPVLASRHYPSR